MTSQTLEWYLKSGTGKRLSTEEEQEKLQKIENKKNDLYHAINSCDPGFIDTYFPNFREEEKENNPNRWKDLPEITENYLVLVAWKLGQYPENHEIFESPKSKLLSVGSRRFRKYQHQQKIVPLLYDSCEDSINEFTAHNMGLVVSIAKRFWASKLPLEELAQYGTFGLKRAVYSFETSRGYKFSTYSSWWIRHAILRSVRDTGKTIRVPSHVHETMQKMRKVQSRLQQNKGSQEVSTEEIAQNMGIDPESVSELLLLQHQEPSSLDNALEKENNDVNYSKTFQEYLEDKDSVSTLEKISKSQIKEILYRVLESTLSPREMDIIKNRFGLGGEETETLQQLGERYGLSRERMRQLEAQALCKLAKNADLREIKNARK